MYHHQRKDITKKGSRLGLKMIRYVDFTPNGMIWFFKTKGSKTTSKEYPVTNVRSFVESQV